MFGLILSVLGLIVLLSWAWWRDRKGNFDPTHNRADVIVNTSALVAILIGASVTLTKIVIEIADILYL